MHMKRSEVSFAGSVVSLAVSATLLCAEAPPADSVPLSTSPEEFLDYRCGLPHLTFFLRLLGWNSGARAVRLFLLSHFSNPRPFFHLHSLSAPGLEYLEAKQSIILSYARADTSERQGVLRRLKAMVHLKHVIIFCLLDTGPCVTQAVLKLTTESRVAYLLILLPPLPRC